MKGCWKTIAAIAAIAALLLPGCGSTVKAQKPTNEPPPVIANKPEPAETLIGVGDTVEVAVYRNDDLKKTLKVDRTGKIMLPLIGDVEVAGRTVYALRDEIQTRLAKFIVNTQVTVSIVAVQSQKALVVGEVKAPGMLTLDLDISIADAIMKSGGTTLDAKTSDIYVIRSLGPKKGGSEKSELIRFDMKNAMATGNFANNVLLRNGDIVYVPTRTISDVSWFMSHIASIIAPFITTETGIVLWPQVVDVLKGETPSTSFSVPTQ